MTDKNITAHESYASTMLNVYRENLDSFSSVRKGKCSMYPSCSAYAKEAFNRLSFFTAWAAVSDRLIRCGRDSEDRLKIIKINNRLRINDPVPQ
ncbi:MAG: membrane protein insertion efficiency factor YidD [Thermodesulfobacteriota bacterium]